MRREFADFFNLAVPFFLPVWRRVATVVLTTLWALVELSNGQGFWGLLFLTLAGIACVQFLRADWDKVRQEAEASDR